MKALAFDTLQYSKRLVEAGFTDRQAEALAAEQAALINDQLATKRDLKEMGNTLTIRMGGMMVTAVIVVAALVKLL